MLRAPLYHLICFALVAICNVCPAQQEQGRALSKQVEQLVTQLNSPRFVDRERATQKLIDQGGGSIEPLVKELSKASPEVIARGVHVLSELAMSTEVGTSERSWTALEQLATQKNNSVSRRASDSLVALHSLRKERARDLLVRNGAKVADRHGQIGGMIVSMVYSVEIPEEFAGDLQVMQQIKWLDDVRQVTLRGEKITNEWLLPLADLKELVVVEVKHSKVNDAGLKPLKGLPNLQYLSVYYSPVTDQAVATMADMPNLTEIRLFGTEVTVEGVDKLQKALALAKIDFRQGAFLGVGCQTHPDGAQVSIMHEESAADRAGMRSGDVIYKFNEHDIANFDDLRAAIAEHPAGKEVTIKALRGGQEKEFKVKLGEWE